MDKGKSGMREILWGDINTELNGLIKASKSGFGGVGFINWFDNVVNLKNTAVIVSVEDILESGYCLCSIKLDASRSV